MDEKKLTDEEIVKALECMTGVQLRDCDNCPFMDGNFCDDFAIARNARDLIHRLQDERDKWFNHSVDLQEQINTLRLEKAKQKAEIERLTEKCETIENLRKIKHSFWEDEMRKNVKLQKQVDELTERYLEESKERCKFEQLYERKCHDYNIGAGVQHSHWKKKVEQAVKDTAKEIWKKVLYFYRQYPLSTEVGLCCLRDWIKDRYGVEVE